MKILKMRFFYFFEAIPAFACIFFAECLVAISISKTAKKDAGSIGAIANCKQEIYLQKLTCLTYCHQIQIFVYLPIQI